MNKAMEKRGPDGEGYIITNYPEFSESFGKVNMKFNFICLPHHQNIGLGHRRLAITDLSSAASQPMCDVTEKYWIVFNGQIYNHVDLRKKLQHLGHSFKTHHSDTEVILNAYKQWGIECLKELEGTWSFCLWDSLNNNVFIARDRVGARPIYYTSLNGAFYFASELNALTTNKQITRELDNHGVYDYLTYTNVPAPRTIYKNIKKLQAAHYIFFKPGEEPIIKKYWNPIGLQVPLTLTEKEIIDQIRERLYEAVRIRMQADVEVGMLLSGGVDSSVNLACMSKYSKNRVKTYTVGFESKNQYQNEFEYARKVASLFNADYQELLVTEKDFFDFLPQLAYLQDEPIADPAITPIYFISNIAAKDNVKVLLGGEGSDELFIGYEHWRLIYEFENYFESKTAIMSFLSFLHKTSLSKTKGANYLSWAYKIRKKTPAFWGGTELRTETYKHKILSPEFLNQIGDYNSFVPLMELYKNTVSKKPYDTFEWMSVNDMQNRLPDQLLARLDRMMMASSIEGRHPFLDVNLIDFVMKIPAQLKTKNKTEKYLLKKAFENILPNEIIYRRKNSFAVPIHELFRNQDKKKPYLDIITSFNKDTGIFNNSYITQLNSPNRLNEFWNVLNLALWHQQRK